MTRPKNDPTSLRVFRGGSWYSTDPARVRASSRVTFAPAFRDFNLGFRCSLAGRMKRRPGSLASVLGSTIGGRRREVESS